MKASAVSPVRLQTATCPQRPPFLRGIRAILSAGPIDHFIQHAFFIHNKILVDGAAKLDNDHLRPVVISFGEGIHRGHISIQLPAERIAFGYGMKFLRYFHDQAFRGEYIGRALEFS